MSDINYKSYTGRWSQSKYMTVDAPSMDVAADVMRNVNNKEPITIVQWKDDVIVADEKSNEIHVNVIVKWVGSDKETGPYGNVYPSHLDIQPNDIAILTAVPKHERIAFMGYQDESGEYVSPKGQTEYAFRAKVDTTLYAVFSDTRVPTSAYTFDANTFMISSDNNVSLNTTDVIINDPYKIPTSRAVYEECERKLESITLNGRDVEIENKQAKIDLTQDYLYEDEDIDFAELF